jgi:hypothetical protein
VSSDYTPVLVPLFAFAVVGVLVFLLRWTFKSGKSLVRGPGRPGHSDDYGLLVQVARPATYVEGEVLRRTLEAAGIRANLAHTLDGPQVMVFPKDESRARAVLAARG